MILLLTKSRLRLTEVHIIISKLTGGSNITELVACKTTYHHFFILFGLKGTIQLFHDKISDQDDKILPFSSALYPFFEFFYEKVIFNPLI